MALPLVDVHFLPGRASGRLGGSRAVVIDVLRATTTIAEALAAGCREVRPRLDVEEAREEARRLGGGAILGGERGGLPPGGFDLGNSPADYTPERCRGRSLVLTTTNGTRAILAAAEAEEVFTAALSNASAVARRLLETPGAPVAIVAAGTDGRLSLEDAACAGLLADALTIGERLYRAGPGARRAIRFYRRAKRDWERVFERARGARNLRRLGLGADVDFCRRIGRLSVVPVVRSDPLRIVAEEAARG